MAKFTGALGPGAEAAGHHIGDHEANVSLLRGIIIGSCVVTRGGQRPAAFANPEFLEEARGIINILTRIEHRLCGLEMVCMKVVIDLHASYIDQPRAALLRFIDLAQRVGKIRGEI